MNSAEPPTNGSVSDSRPPVYPPSEVVVDRKISTETGLKSPLPGVTRTLSLGLNKSLKVTFAPPVLPGGSPPSENYMNLVGKAWQRKVLQDLTEQTHFSSTELQVLLNHFTDLQSSDDHLDKDTFFKCLGQAFGTTERELLVHIYGAMDEHDRGYVSFKQFVCALSTVFRGDKDDILEFWFRMYDSDHDGLLTKKDFEELLMDVNTATRKAVAVYVEQLFGNEGEGIDEEVAPVLDEELGDSQEEVLISFEEFRTIMEEYDVIPIFVNPHKFAQHKQAPAFRNMAPAEREVTLLLGTELRPVQGHMLIEENAKCDHFFFVLEGEVSMERGGVHLGTITDGQFLGEAALFEDVKQQDEDGTVTFTTAARVSSPTAHILSLNIHDFYPLVYHEHPGATAIVQRLGRVMLERFQQTEERLQQILQSQAAQSAAGMRLSSKDWAAFRKRLTKQWALKYHKIGRKGKLEVVPTKLMGTKEDLSVAYSPGVAEPCLIIQQNERYAYEYTAKGHLIGVITNGTAVLGLGNIGPLAGKPVMEGKSVLFKKFADLDAFDIEIQQEDPQKLVDIIVALEPTFGGVNLEDIKAPECFFVERECQARMNIPVFHDDQHGTAIIAGAGLLNALELVKKDIADIRVVVCGCGAAGYTCATYFMTLGVKREHMIATDVKGVVYEGREDITPDNYLSNVAAVTDKRTLREAIVGADVFLGLSAGNLLTPEMLLTMARDPVIFACANPSPEIDPDLARATRSDVIMCTGRSDFPNQINNVCAFPYIFRGALDCRARKVNEAMKLAATNAIAKLAKLPPMKRRTPSVGDLLHLHKAPSQLEINGEINPANGSSSIPAIASTNGAAAHAGSDSGCSDSLSRVSIGSGVRHASPARLRRRTGGSYPHLPFLEGGGSAPDSPANIPPFGRDYIIPKPFDERLLPEVAGAVVQAAIETGVARKTDFDLKEYKRSLTDLSLKTSL